jgi:DNA primase
MVVIPVCSETGELLGFKGRTFREDAPLPRYRVIGDKTGNTWGFGTVQVQHEVFNIHALEKGEPVIIVEGEFDAMMLWQYGFTNIVSLYGSTFTEAQKHKLLSASNNFILFLDSDEAGERCRDKIVRELQDCSIIKIVEKHDGDPAELTKEECATLIENAKSQLQYHLMNIERN